MTVLNDKEGHRWPSFFLFPAAIFALATSIFASNFNYVLGIVCLLVLLLFQLQESINKSPIVLSLFIYGFIVILNIQFIDNARDTNEIFYFAYLIIGFVVFSKLTKAQIIYVYQWLLFVLVLLSLWGFVQFHTGEFYIAATGKRANAIFYTPNTFAASLNLFLFPVIAIFLTKNKYRTLITSLIVILFYTLLITKSRGGWLSFSIGVGLISFIYLFVYKKQIKKLIYLYLIIMFTIMVFTFGYNIKNLKILPNSISDYIQQIDFQHITRSKNISTQTVSRQVLYIKAWERIKQKPWLGHGYHNFQYYWLKDQQAPFKNNHTDFVHNDYLQIWMETGIFSLLAILSIIFNFYFGLFRYCRKQFRYDDEKLTNVLAITGGLSAYFAHAMVDFVFFPCFLVLIFSAYLALANKIFYAKYTQKQDSNYAI